VIRILDRSATEKLISYDDAIAVTRSMFARFDSGEAVIFPVTRGHGSTQGTRFGLKAGFDRTLRQPGLKVGSYWPGNAAKGLPNHGSTTLLLDDETGFPIALVESTWLNALRTSASDAVAVDLLARKDASVLAVIGTGHQAYHEAHAVARVRPLADVIIAGRDPEKAARLAERLRADGLPARCAEIGNAVGVADIVVTVTAARGALFSSQMVRPGTHISAMGADGPGKQELPADLAYHALLFADAVEQSTTIGEFQMLAGTPAADTITPIGAVINGRRPGRSRADGITLYDSSGIALQDITIAALALERAQAAGLGVQVAF
jgi:ornithine cyclodeaminase/alanine dehydrogenase-like protein (mu-crystallin family)